MKMRKIRDNLLIIQAIYSELWQWNRRNSFGKRTLCRQQIGISHSVCCGRSSFFRLTKLDFSTPFVLWFFYLRSLSLSLSPCLSVLYSCNLRIFYSFGAITRSAPSPTISSFRKKKKNFFHLRVDANFFFIHFGRFVK